MKNLPSDLHLGTFKTAEYGTLTRTFRNKGSPPLCWALFPLRKFPHQLPLAPLLVPGGLISSKAVCGAPQRLCHGSGAESYYIYFRHLEPVPSSLGQMWPLVLLTIQGTEGHV